MQIKDLLDAVLKWKISKKQCLLYNKYINYNSCYLLFGPSCFRWRKSKFIFTTLKCINYSNGQIVEAEWLLFCCCWRGCCCCCCCCRCGIRRGFGRGNLVTHTTHKMMLISDRVNTFSEKWNLSFSFSLSHLFSHVCINTHTGSVLSCYHDTHFTP